MKKPEFSQRTKSVASAAVVVVLMTFLLWTVVGGITIEPSEDQDDDNGRPVPTVTVTVDG